MDGKALVHPVKRPRPCGELGGFDPGLNSCEPTTNSATSIMNPDSLLSDLNAARREAASV